MCFQACVFLDKEFLLRDNGSKVELEEVQNAREDANQLPEPEPDIPRDEIAVDPFEAQVFHRSSKYVLFHRDMDFSSVN